MCSVHFSVFWSLQQPGASVPQAEAFAASDQELQTTHAELAGKYSELKQVRTGRPETLKGDDPTSLARFVRSRHTPALDLVMTPTKTPSKYSPHVSCA